MFATISGKTKEAFEIWMQANILEGVAVATTLGDTLVEYQCLCFGSFPVQGLGLLGSIDSLCRLLRPPHLPRGQTWFTLYQLSRTQQKIQRDHSVSKLGRVVWLTSLKFSKYKFSSLVFLNCQQAWTVP